MNDASTADVKMVPAASLGGPGRPDPTRCSAAAIEALAAVASADMGMTQIQLDIASQAVGRADVHVRARIDKRTRSIVFASVEAMTGDMMIFRAQALFSRKHDPA
jgi:hypothetical protein